ncbi:MAG: alanine/glycine:cation symporter family protein [Christensenellales bacterium]
MELLKRINDIIWSAPLIILLIGVGVYFTCRCRLIQLHVFSALRGSMKKSGKGDLSPMQSLCTMLAATLGTGNIVGVATAVALVTIGGGGAGALFWMALSAFFAMATIYAEGVLAIKFRRFNSKGEVTGGPFYYIEDGLGKKFRPLAKLFALFGVCATCLGMGTAAQSNAILSSFEIMLDMPGSKTLALVVAIALVLLSGFVLLGGVHRVGSVVSVVVPFMAVFYIIGCLLIILVNADALPGAFSTILKEAFSLKSAGLGIGGTCMAAAIRMGVARGLFTNEAGMGTTPIASATASTNDPAKQGLMSAFSTFVDTLVISMLSGLVLIITGAHQSQQAGLQSTVDAFSRGLPFAPWVGKWVVTLGLILFAYATIIGWSFYGEKCSEYLFGERSVRPYRFFFLICLFFTPFIPFDAVWQLGDIFNALMALPNLIALLLLRKVVARETDLYFERRHRRFRKNMYI